MKTRKKVRPPLLPVLLLGVILAVVCTVIACAAQPAPEKERDFSARVEGAPVSRAASSQAAAGRSHKLSEETSQAPVQLSDPLLVLVNEDTPLPEDWQVNLISINDGEQVDARAYDDLMAMVNAAGQEDIWFWIASGYRSVESQQAILDQGVVERLNQGMDEKDAEADALRTIQRPGYSEHHTGLAVDFNDVSDGFEETEAYWWLSEHAAEYGFVQRYRGDKADITGIDHESWHYRYVGKEHAQEMERLDLCLEEYVAYLKEQGVS